MSRPAAACHDPRSNRIELGDAPGTAIATYDPAAARSRGERHHRCALAGLGRRPAHSCGSRRNARAHRCTVRSAEGMDRLTRSDVLDLRRARRGRLAGVASGDAVPARRRDQDRVHRRSGASLRRSTVTCVWLVGWPRIRAGSRPRSASGWCSRTRRRNRRAVAAHRTLLVTRPERPARPPPMAERSERADPRAVIPCCFPRHGQKTQARPIACDRGCEAQARRGDGCGIRRGSDPLELLRRQRRGQRLYGLPRQMPRATGERWV